MVEESVMTAHLAFLPIMSKAAQTCKKLLQQVKKINVIG
jgi:hypothetical protein